MSYLSKRGSVHVCIGNLQGAEQREKQRKEKQTQGIKEYGEGKRSDGRAGTKMGS